MTRPCSPTCPRCAPSATRYPSRRTVSTLSSAPPLSSAARATGSSTPTPLASPNRTGNPRTDTADTEATTRRIAVPRPARRTRQRAVVDLHRLRGRAWSRLGGTFAPAEWGRAHPVPADIESAGGNHRARRGDCRSRPAEPTVHRVINANPVAANHRRPVAPATAIPRHHRPGRLELHRRARLHRGRPQHRPASIAGEPWAPAHIIPSRPAWGKWTPSRG